MTAGFALLAALLTAVLHSKLTFTNTYIDVWFDSDSAFVLDVMTNRWSLHNTAHHPLFALLTFPAVFMLRLVGLTDTAAAFVVLLVVSTSVVVSMFVALRVLGRPRTVSTLFTGILLASTPSVLYLGVHERLMLGGLSILLCLIGLKLVERNRVPGGALVAAAAGTLGITVTNFVVGIASLWAAFGWRRSPMPCLRRTIHRFRPS